MSDPGYGLWSGAAKRFGEELAGLVEEMSRELVA